MRYENWRDRAACVGMPLALFFPDSGPSKGIPQAKRICAECTVTKQCLDEALACERADGRYRYGTYGGMTATERREKFDESEDVA